MAVQFSYQARTGALDVVVLHFYGDKQHAETDRDPNPPWVAFFFCDLEGIIGGDSHEAMPHRMYDV